MIKKINSIKNMAVFQDFQWKSSVQDAEFKKINILYGRNYSGKTTLSRIFRAFETGEISKEYKSSEFKLNLENSDDLTQDSLKTHNQLIRVFNKDFVKENLQFIIDDTQSIKSFAILGEDNTRIKNDIEKHEAELGSESDKSGLFGEQLRAEEKFKKAKKDHADRSKKLDNQLFEKANNKDTGIRHNKVYGDSDYKVPRLKKDLETVFQDTYAPLADEQVTEHCKLLSGETKSEIPESSSFNLQYSTIASKAKELIGKKIQTSEPIQELLNDTILTQWVREGREHHKKENRDTCGFCGNNLPEDLWEKLDKHFNQESEALRRQLERAFVLIEQEQSNVEKLLKINASDFYSTFEANLNSLEKQLSILLTTYSENLNFIKNQIEKRSNDIFKHFEFDAPDSVEKDLHEIRNVFEGFRKESNKITTSMSTKQSEARTALLRHEIYIFMKDINYKDELKVIDSLTNVKNEADKDQTAIKEKVEEKRAKIKKLKAQLKDESKGAEQINTYLNHYFGHQSLSLKAIKESSIDESSGYRFEIRRNNNQKATHLSEGECSLISFCYFMAKLEDTETKGDQPIIWIDDPISSLDANHIFFVYSLIKDNIASKDNKQILSKQLFISTHNLEFLKYLKSLLPDRSKNEIQYFMLTQTNSSGDIVTMPKYLSGYATEFNFLFDQIHKCAEAKDDDDNHDCYYNFGNNARKFLEALLYYKYPNATENRSKKMKRFFNNDQSTILVIDRVTNEHSHLKPFDSHALQPDIPMMKTVANSIIETMKKNDPDQYNALCESINPNSNTSN